jgi:hypothetical protein
VVQRGVAAPGVRITLYARLVGGGTVVRLALILPRGQRSRVTGVFDPPPEQLTIPTSYLIALLAATLGAVVIAGIATLTSLQRPVLERLPDL